MSDELLELAQSVVARALPGEGMEVYVTRGTETEVRAYEGEVESLTSADSSGVGIRLVLGDADAGGSQVGFAWAGSLEPDVIAATLADARDNARFATPDPDVVLAAPDGVEAVELDLWDDGVGATPMEKKVALAIELERATRAADPRVRQVSSADYSDSRVEVALASTTGIESSRRRTNAFLSVDAIAGEGADSQTGTGFTVGRGPAELVPDEAMDDAVLRATRMLGAQKVPSSRLTVVFDQRVVSTLLGVMASALSGEAVVKGRSFFAGRIGESIAAAGFTLVDDPTDARAYGASSHDGEGLACRRNVLIAEGVLRMFVYDTVSARRAGAVVDRIGDPGRFRRHARCGVSCPGALPWHEEPGRDPRRGRRRALRTVDLRHPLRGQHGERRLLGRGGGSPDSGGCAHPAGARSHRRVHPAEDVAVGGGDRRRPALAARRGCRSDPGGRRHGAERRLIPQPAVLEAGAVCLPELPLPEPPLSELLLSEPPLSELPLSEPLLSELPLSEADDSFFGVESPPELSPLWVSAPFFPEPLVPEAARESVL